MSTRVQSRIAAYPRISPMKRTWLLGGTAFKSEAVRFMSSMLYRCHNSLRAVQSKADALSHFIGRKKANAIKIARQPVGVLSNIFNGIIAVFLVDTNGKKGADAVRLQKHHHFPDRTMVIQASLIISSFF